jgi:acyl carrier protein
MTTSILQEKIALGDGQMQLLMGEFEKQRDMLMRLCENQNALLASALSGVSLEAVPVAAPYRPTPALALAPELPLPVANVEAAVSVAPAAVVFPSAVTEAPAVAAAAPAPTFAPTPATAAPVSLFDYVRSLMAKAVDMRDNDIDPDQNIMELGADSMTAMSMVKELEQRYSIELPATLLFEYATLNELVEFLKTEIGSNAA